MEVKNYTLDEVQSCPLSFLRKITLDGEDLVTYKVDGRLVFLINRPDIIKRILSSRNKYYIKKNTPEMYMLKPILGNGMLTSEGETWKHQRDTAQSGFTKEYVLKFINIMVEETKLMIDEFKDGSIVDLEKELSQLTLQIVGRSLFGTSLKKVAIEFGESVKVINKYMGHFNPSNIEDKQQFEESLKYIRTLVSNIVTERKKQLRRSDDLLDILLNEKANNENIFNTKIITDQIFTFLMAGHETTAKALTWTFYELIQNREKLNCLQTEIDSILNGELPNAVNIHNLNYTWMVIREGMRLNPPVWIMSRVAAEEDIIEGITIPKDSTVLISPYLIHRHKNYWDEPEVFIPERFKKEVDEKRDHFAYIPFSAGPRRCIGLNFANIEMTIILAMIVQDLKMKLKEEFKVEHEALVTLRPKYGMKVLINKK